MMGDAENVYWPMRARLLPMSVVVDAAVNEQDLVRRRELMHAVSDMAKDALSEFRELTEEADADVQCAAWLVTTRLLAVATLGGACDNSPWDKGVASEAEFQDAAADAFIRLWDAFDAADSETWHLPAPEPSEV